MRSFYTLALFALPCFASAAPSPSLGNAIYASAQEAFQDLLDAVPEESLKAALSGLKGWKDGVFETQHRGVELVHDSNPALATKIIVAAVQDLKKRQSKPSNSTGLPPPRSSSTPPPQQSSQAPPPPASSSPPVIVTTTQSVVVPTSVPSSVPASVTVASSTPAQPTSNPAGRTTVQTSASPSPSSGQVLTSTDSDGSTFVTTFTPSIVKVSSVKLITTTGADGKPSTITSYTYVDATAAPTTTGKPGLQNGAVQQLAPFQVAAACAGALAMFL